MKVKHAAANVVIVFFLLLFLGLPLAIGLVGIAVLFQSLAEFYAGNSENTLAYLALGVAFVSGGVFGVYAVIRSGKLGKREQKLRRKYPEEPWKWRDDWADGQAAPTEKYSSGGLGFWIVPILWFSMGGFLTYGAVAALWTPEWVEAALALLILVPLHAAILAFTIRQTVRRRKFGRPVFRIASIPAVPGGSLKGDRTND